MLVISGLMTIGALRFQLESLRQQSDPALAMMNYVAANKTPVDIYMIPPKMENFRLVAGAPILVDFKTAPDSDADVMKWYQRLQWVSWFYQSDPNPCKLLNDIKSLYGVTHVVTERDYRPTQCDSLKVVYKDAYYRIYEITPRK